MDDIQIILLHSYLNTSDRLFIPKCFRDKLTEAEYIENIKSNIKKLKDEKISSRRNIRKILDQDSNQTT